MGGEKAIKCLGSGFNKQNEKMRAREDLESRIFQESKPETALRWSLPIFFTYNQSIHSNPFKAIIIIHTISNMLESIRFLLSSYLILLEFTDCLLDASGRWEDGRCKLSHTTILLTFSGRIHLSGKCIFLHGTTM